MEQHRCGNQRRGIGVDNRPEDTLKAKFKGLASGFAFAELLADPLIDEDVGVNSHAQS